ncbi:hypothetical protein GCK72_017393 [Caenorhabditis remanei]|uniref:Uncharacterized protein n=1 Tax=Caenorhabditis remanei TaxID=31234 RepID=A0A6A5G852_CAERE|nr:hypothetical protein GCK72_017393 [Caenorhabditis remanei]KAF1750842.1 hypothetical protein GCK72_017393 [Caenorhabditis remanei]
MKKKNRIQDEVKNRDNLLAVANSEIESIKKRIEEKTGEALKLKENIDFCGTVIKDLRKEIWECAEELKIKKNSSILLENQANSLKRSNLQLKDCADSLHKQLSDTISRKSGDIMDAMIAQKRGCDVQHDRQVKTMKRTIQEMTMSSPSHGAKLKPYKDLKSPDSKKARLKSVLSYLKKEIGEDGFDGFVTDFVNYVAADPEFSFKLKLSDIVETARFRSHTIPRPAIVIVAVIAPAVSSTSTLSRRRATTTLRHSVLQARRH